MIDADNAIIIFLAGSVPVLISFIVQFIALRIRDTRAMPHDPQLGRKAALFLFFNLAIFLVLFGLTISSLDWAEYLFESAVQAQEARQNPPPVESDPVPFPAATTTSPRDWFNEMQRTAAAFIACGLMYAILFAVLIRYATNSRDIPTVRRAFAGSRFVIIGLVVMAVATLSVLQIFQRGETQLKQLEKYIAVAVVWGPAAAIHLVLLLFRTSEPRE